MRSSRSTRGVSLLPGGSATVSLLLLATYVLLLCRPAAALAEILESSAGSRGEQAGLVVRNGDGGEKNHSRVRRFVPFPSGGKIELTVKLILPVSGKMSFSTYVIANAFIFKLPTEYFSVGRSYTEAAADDRAFLYSSLESFLDGFGYDGHACTLRTLCEIAEAPFQHDLYGEVINLVLSASNSPNNSAEYDDYMLAEHYGRNYGDCGSIYYTCPTSVLDLISHSF